MEALKLKATTANGMLSVAVPDAFNNREVEIILLSLENTSSQALDTANDERVKRLLSVIGNAKYPDTVIDKHDAYNQ